MNGMATERERLAVRLAMVWLLILPLAAFWVSWLRPAGAADLAVFPVLPKANEPVVATLRIGNPQPDGDPARFALYADGRIVLEGTTAVPGEAANVVQFARTLPEPARGSYAARVVTAHGAHSKSHQLPEYSPQVLSSFVSFAASSTTMMTSLINMSYYRSSFASANVLDFGLGMLAHRLRLVLVSLYIVFGGLAITRLALLFGVVS